MTYHADGFCLLQNPSPKGGGYTVVDENGKIIKHEVFSKKGWTNNEAELWGIYSAIKIAQNGDTVITDSQCCKLWAHNGKTKTRPDLNFMCREANELMRTKGIHLQWRPREENLAGHYNEKFERWMLHLPKFRP